MPTLRSESMAENQDAELRPAAMNRLQAGTNPFTAQVAAIGTADESLQTSVPEFTVNQLADLFDIIGSYRGDNRPSTRVYPVLGDRGAGKTLLLYSLRRELRQRALQSGEETMVVVVDRLSAGMDPIDYFLWQIVNYLLSQKGDGERMLGMIAARVTGRLLAEALRNLAPHKRIELIPPVGIWDRIRLSMGHPARVQARLDGITEVIQICDGKNLQPEELRLACQAGRLSPETALKVLTEHLERTESKDILGWFRKQVYAALAKLVLLGVREPFEELHTGDYAQAPVNVRNAGNLSRRLLETWIELLAALNVPVVVVFDQLEDYLLSPDADQEKTNRRYFTSATALFINELKHVCILIFAELGLWTELINQAEPFAAERLKQPFALPGRPAKSYIMMPEKVSLDVLTRLIGQRLEAGFRDLDLTGLPPSFPFEEADLKHLKDETSIRACLRRLAKRYDEIVYPVTRRPKSDLKTKLAELWKDQVVRVQAEYGSELSFKVAFIPKVQIALQGWLNCLEELGLTGSGPWYKVEMITDPEKQPYGNLCVIRANGPHARGIGIAVWLGNGKARSFDLGQRLGFFVQRPCPIKTLIMLRADGEDALTGETKAVYDKAVRAGRDIRVYPYEAKHFHALMAFSSWLQAASAELEAARDSDPNADQAYRTFMADLSKELLGWIDSWRIAASAKKESLV